MHRWTTPEKRGNERERRHQGHNSLPLIFKSFGPALASCTEDTHVICHLNVYRKYTENTQVSDIGTVMKLTLTCRKLVDPTKSSTEVYVCKETSGTIFGLRGSDTFRLQVENGSLAPPCKDLRGGNRSSVGGAVWRTHTARRLRRELCRLTALLTTRKSAPGDVRIRH